MSTRVNEVVRNSQIEDLMSGGPYAVQEISTVRTLCGELGGVKTHKVKLVSLRLAGDAHGLDVVELEAFENGAFPAMAIAARPPPPADGGAGTVSVEIGGGCAGPGGGTQRFGLIARAASGAGGAAARQPGAAHPEEYQSDPIDAEIACLRAQIEQWMSLCSRLSIEIGAMRSMPPLLFTPPHVRLSAGWEHLPDPSADGIPARHDCALIWRAMGMR